MNRFELPRCLISETAQEDIGLVMKSNGLEALAEKETEVRQRGFGGCGLQDLSKPFKYQCFGSLEAPNHNNTFSFLTLLVLKCPNRYKTFSFLICLAS